MRLSAGDKHIFRQPSIHVLADDLMLRANCDLARAAKLAFTTGYQRIHGDFITGGPARHLCANRIYDTGYIDAGGQWQGDVAKLRTAADADVKPIQGAGVDPDCVLSSAPGSGIGACSSWMTSRSPCSWENCC